MGGFPKILAFTPAVHNQITRKVPQSQLACRAGCQKMLAEVQTLADSRFGNGDKSDGRLYLHYIQPVFGYSLRAHRWVSKQLGISKRRPLANLDDFVRLSEKRAFRTIVHNTKKSGGPISHQMAGEFLYILGTLIHTHQDRKHLENNWTDVRNEGISSVEHFSTELHHFFSDTNPSARMRQRALKRTFAFLNRFKKCLQHQLGSQEADQLLETLRDFQIAPGRKAHQYRPSQRVMHYIFPEYPVANPPPILMGPL